LLRGIHAVSYVSAQHPGDLSTGNGFLTGD